MSVTGRSSDDADIDLIGLFAALWRRRMLVLMSTVALGGLAFAGASVVSPKFQSEARVLIESRTPDLARRPTDLQQQPVLDEAGVASQVELLRSDDLIRRVARDFKLHERTEFDPSASPSVLTRLLVLTGLAKNPLDVSPEERVLREFTQKLDVYQVEKSRVIAIQFSSKDPRLAADIPNAMAKVYLSLQSGAKLDSTSETARWLEPEIANLREKVNDAERKVADYRASSDLFRTGQQNTFSEQQLTDISQEITRVRGERANAEARAESVRAMIKSGRDADSLNEVVGSQMIQRLKETQSGIEGQIADLSTQLLDGHPRLKGLRSQLDGIRQQIRQETRKILASLENEASVAKLREQQLVGQLNTLKADTATSEGKQVGLNALEREAAAQRQLLETYLARYREAMSQQEMNATPADARIVSAAAMPTLPYFPKTLPIVIVASLAGFMLSAVYVLLAELFSGRAIRQRVEDDEDLDVVEDVEPAAQPLAYRAEIAASSQKHREGAATPSSADLDAADREAASLLSIDVGVEVPDAQGGEEDRVDSPGTPDDGEFSIAAVARHLTERDVAIAVAVSLAGDKGSSATVDLARAIAATGRRTILIDMTVGALPSGRMLGKQTLPGVTDLLTGEAAFADSIHADLHSDAHVMPRGMADARSAMRGADRLTMIIDALANAYDLVLVECGPADVAGVERLARRGEAEIILAAPGVAADAIEATAGRFIEAGYEDVVLMLSEPSVNPPREGRRAA